MNCNVFIIWAIPFIIIHKAHCNEKLLLSMQRIFEINRLSFNLLNQNLGIPFIYTFPKSLCLQISTDNSLFAARMLNIIQKTEASPALIYDTRPSIFNCKGYLLLTKTLKELEINIKKLPKWAQHRILCLVNLGNFDQVETFLKENTGLFGDAEVMVVLLNNTNIGYKLEQPIRTFKKILIDKGQWDFQLDGITKFQRREVKVITFNCSIFSFIGPIQDNGHPSFAKGYDFELFKEMSSRMNITYKVLYQDETEKYGTFINGTWSDGFYEKISSGKADVGFCGSLIESSKVNTGVEMSAPVQLICFKYIVRRPPELSANWLGIFSPFNYDIWLTLLATLVSLSFGLCIFSKLVVKLDIFKTERYENLGTCWFTLIGILVLGSWPKCNTSLGPIRHILTWWVIFTLLITNSYTSILVSNLTAVRYSKKANTIQEFLDQRYFWPVSQKPYQSIFNMNTPRHTKWVNTAKIVPSKPSLFKILNNNKKAVILSQEIEGANTMINEQIPEYILKKYETVEQCLASVYEGFAYRLGSPFSQAFDFYIRALRESGISHRIISNLMHRLSRKSPSVYELRKRSTQIKDTSMRRLSLENLKGIFDVLALGLTISFITFVVEIVYGNLKEN